MEDGPECPTSSSKTKLDSSEGRSTGNALNTALVARMKIARHSDLLCDSEGRESKICTSEQTRKPSCNLSINSGTGKYQLSPSFVLKLHFLMCNSLYIYYL